MGVCAGDAARYGSLALPLPLACELVDSHFSSSAIAQPTILSSSSPSDTSFERNHSRRGRFGKRAHNNAPSLKYSPRPQPSLSLSLSFFSSNNTHTLSQLPLLLHSILS